MSEFDILSDLELDAEDKKDFSNEIEDTENFDFDSILESNEDVDETVLENKDMFNDQMNSNSNHSLDDLDLLLGIDSSNEPQVQQPELQEQEVVEESLENSDM